MNINEKDRTHLLEELNIIVSILVSNTSRMAETPGYLMGKVDAAKTLINALMDEITPQKEDDF